MALVALALVGAWWLFIRDDAPPPANLQDAVAGLETDERAPPSSTTTEGSSEATDGEWLVDTTIGSFADFTNSWVGYRIDEELATIGANTAAGRTPAVEGSLTLTGTSLDEVVITADMTQLESDDNRRDNQLTGRGLETDSFPTAMFTLTTAVDFGSVPADGSPQGVDAVGELSLHGVTQTVTVALEAQLVDDVIAVVGSAPIVLADYDIEAPTGLLVASVADEGEFEFEFFFSRV